MVGTASVAMQDRVVFEVGIAVDIVAFVGY